ncbi:MAG: hypothetical protein ACKN9D_09575 [Actinomycetales bacterium]
MPVHCGVEESLLADAVERRRRGGGVTPESSVPRMHGCDGWALRQGWVGDA